MSDKSKAEYLRKYRSAPPPGFSASDKKQKKKKIAAAAQNLQIVDLQDDSWRQESESEDDAEAPTAVILDDDVVAKFKKRDTSGWNTVQVTAPDDKKEDEDDDSLFNDQLRREYASDARARERSPVRAGDLSPPRRHVQDQSPPRRHVQDQSPPRRQTRDESPPRRQARDESPPRRPTRDESPPRRHARDESPPRRQARDESPPRRQARDESPPRRQAQDASPPRHSDLPSFMASGARAGLQSGSAVAEDAQLRRSEEHRKIASMDLVESGRFAETVYRDKSGRKVDLKLEKMKKEQEERKKQEEQEARMEWGRGLVQSREREERARQLNELSNAPFARYADDRQLNEDLKQKSRWGDPMAGKTSSKSTRVERPVYRGPPPPPNRFNIPPGYRWDGVDRSNGFEKQHFERLSLAIAKEEDRYKYSVSDM